tara:strand:- start:369 stop:974 length:606 start_codon:yes stop_codon:yes gene_type:complete
MVKKNTNANKQTSSKKDHSTKSKKQQKQETQVAASTDTSSQEVSKKVDPLKELSLDVEFSEIIAGVQGLQHQLATLKTHVRTIEKQYARNLKAAVKLGRKNRQNRANRQPSGFVKPTRISKELAVFLRKPDGTEMARTEVTKEINAYIREHKLQDPKNGRKILADKKLSTLLSLGKNEELTYFNLQKYMSPHFAKASSSKS